MHLQVDGDQQQLLAEDVHILGPALHPFVSTRPQLIIEEAVEEVDLVGHGVHHQVPIHIHHLVVEPIGAIEGLQVVHGQHVPFVADPEAPQQRIAGQPLVGLHQLLHRAPPLRGAELLLEDVLQLLHHFVGADGDEAPVGLQELVPAVRPCESRPGGTANEVRELHQKGMQ